MRTLGGVSGELARKLVRLRSNAERDSERARVGKTAWCRGVGEQGQSVRTSSVLSSCSVRGMCVSALGMAIIE